jgi:hypothetical protein
MRLVGRPLNLSFGVFFWCVAAGIIGSSSARASDESMIKIGTGKAKFNAVLQTWAFADTTAATNHFNFKIRRAELKFAGEMVENSRWFLMLDPAKSLSTNSNGTINTARDNKILVDFVERDFAGSNIRNQREFSTISPANLSSARRILKLK